MTGSASLTQKPRSCPSGCGQLQGFSFRGVTLDKCPQCAGIWFDSHEYDRLERLPEASFYTLENIVIPAGEPGGVAEGSRGCPACGSKLTPTRMHPQGIPVVLDQCRLCGGLWAEDQELVALSRVWQVYKPSFEQTAAQPLRQKVAQDVAAQINAQEMERMQLLESVIFRMRQWLRTQETRTPQMAEAE